MRAHVSIFRVQKNGLSFAENEDAVWVETEAFTHGIVEGVSLRAAIADGASESILSGRWAKLLVRTYGLARSDESFIQVVDRAIGEWDSVLRTYLTDRALSGRPIQWYEEPGIERGAHSTLLGVEFTSDGGEGGSWRAEALGDVCLFHVRDCGMIRVFPMSTSVEFGFSPDLVQSRPANGDLLKHRLRTDFGDWREGDTFYLATDAIAAWMMSENETGNSPWKILSDFGTSGGVDYFSNWVANLRASGRLRNDDVTLARIDSFSY